MAASLLSVLLLESLPPEDGGELEDALRRPAREEAEEVAQVRGGFELVKLGRTLRQYRAGLLAAIRLDLSNGRMEGLNNDIGVIKHAPTASIPSPPLPRWSSSAARPSAQTTHLKLREG